MTVVSALNPRTWQRQVDLSAFKVSLVYRARIAKANERNSVSKKQETKNTRNKKHTHTQKINKTKSHRSGR